MLEFQQANPKNRPSTYKNALYLRLINNTFEKHTFMIIHLLSALLMMAALEKPTELPLESGLIFQDKPWEELKAQAKQEKKLFFVMFGAGYCAPCHQMEQTTFRNEKLGAFAQQHVVALKLDIQSFLNDDIMWAQQYEVTEVPTMLVFNAKGKLANRFSGYKSGKELLALFEKAYAPNKL